MSWRMPAEWAAHDRTLMAWPAREDMWEDLWEDAQAVYAEVANAIAAFEPVTMVARPQISPPARTGSLPSATERGSARTRQQSRRAGWSPSRCSASGSTARCGRSRCSIQPAHVCAARVNSDVHC